MEGQMGIGVLRGWYCTCYFAVDVGGEAWLWLRCVCFRSDETAWGDCKIKRYFMHAWCVLSTLVNWALLHRLLYCFTNDLASAITKTVDTFLLSITQAGGPGVGALLPVTNTTRTAANLTLSVRHISRAWLGKYSRWGSCEDLHPPGSGRHSERERKYTCEGYRNRQSIKRIGHEVKDQYTRNRNQWR